MNLFPTAACMWLVAHLCVLLTAGDHLVEFVSNYQQNAEVMVVGRERNQENASREKDLLPYVRCK